MWFIRFWEALFLAAGSLLVGLAARNLARGSASRRWPRTEGRILRSFVLVDQGTEGGEGFTPKVEYEYRVEGKAYRGMRLRYGQTGSWNRKQAERTIAPYGAGAAVPVCFNPRNPADAVLVTGVSWGNVAILLAGLVSLVVACLLVVHGS